METLNDARRGAVVTTSLASRDDMGRQLGWMPSELSRKELTTLVYEPIKMHG